MNYDNRIRSETSEPLAGNMGLDGETREGRSRKWLWIGLVALLLAAIVGGYFAFKGEDAATLAAGERSEQAPSVTVISPGSGTVEGVITATGTLAARRQMPIGANGEGGRVVSVPVDAGDWVREGQVLAVIDRSVQSQQAEAARAQINVAQADADLAQSNLERAQQLIDRGFISKAEIDRLTATRDAARARVSVARAQLNELQARNARLNIVAPAAGLVLERNVEPGQTVSAGSGVLFTIARGGEMEMLAEVGETELARISAGVPAEVTPVGTDKRFTGQVWQIAPVINEQDRQGRVRIALPYAPELRPGGFATASIGGGSFTAPILPESAILSDDEGSFVYIVGENNTAERRNIETGLVTSQGVSVVSGLNGSERIVERAGGFLTAGETIRPVLADRNAD